VHTAARARPPPPVGCTTGSQASRSPAPPAHGAPPGAHSCARASAADALLGLPSPCRTSRVLLPICFLAGVFNYLDRTNLTFAALQLNADLGFTPKVKACLAPQRARPLALSWPSSAHHQPTRRVCRGAPGPTHPPARRASPAPPPPPTHTFLRTMASAPAPSTWDMALPTSLAPSLQCGSAPASGKAAREAPAGRPGWRERCACSRRPGSLALSLSRCRRAGWHQQDLLWALPWRRPPGRRPRRQGGCQIGAKWGCTMRRLQQGSEAHGAPPGARCHLTRFRPQVLCHHQGA
jgi:hypothetical protein